MRPLLDGTWVVDYTLTGQPIVHGVALPLPTYQPAPTTVKVQVAQAFRAQTQASATMRRRVGR